MTLKTKTLPQHVPMTMSLEDCLKNRRSGREFDPKRTLSDEVLASLLFAACGQSGENGLRTCPSTLNRRSVSVCVVREDGVWRYNERSATLEPIRKGDYRDVTTAGQDFVKDAPVTFAIVYDEEKGRGPDGEALPIVWAWADAALIAENIYLASTALGLSGVTRAWFDPEKSRRELGLRSSETALLMHTVGYPKH